VARQDQLEAPFEELALEHLPRGKFLGANKGQIVGQARISAGEGKSKGNEEAEESPDS
jgi:hypothetical protein